MYTTHRVSDSLRRTNGGCEESLTRSAFNRWVSGIPVHIDINQIILPSFLFGLPQHIFWDALEMDSLPSDVQK